MDFEVFTSECCKTFKLINWQTDKYSSFHFDIDPIFIHSNDMNLFVSTCKITHYKFITNSILYANQSLATEYINQSQAYNGTWHIWLFTQLLAIT